MAYSSVEAKSIQELCKVIDCEHKTAPYVEKSDYLVVRTSNVRNGRMVMEDMKYTTLEGFKAWTQRAVPEAGDVLFTREAPAGESCLVPKDKKVCMGQRMVMLRPNREKVDPIFLSLVLATEKSKFDILRLSIGSTVSRINIADIKKLRIAAPPLLEQRKVAQILSTWDKAIATSEQLLANSHQQKKALMQKLFSGKSRFSNFDDKFRYRFFYELLNIDSKNLGVGISGDYLFDYISLSDVKSGRINDHLERHFFKDAPSRARRILTEGDILFSTVRPNLQGFAKVGGNHKECISSTGFSVLTPKDKVCGNYIYHYLYSSHITAQINTLVVGTNYPAINSSDVARLRIYCPGYEEQKRIARVLDNCDKDIEALNHKLFLLKQEKKALMQQLLTGKRRVKVEAA